MMVSPTKFDGVLIIEPKVFDDDRGWFMETYNKKTLEDQGINIDFIQDNRSLSKKKGSLRGLHYQKKPHAQSKLVRCIKGSAFDVVVDLRKDSRTYKQWLGVNLTEENKKSLFIPKGFAHGFLTLEDNTEIEYKVDDYWYKELEVSIRFDDPEIGIEWMEKDPILSQKDKNAFYLKDCDIDF